MSSDLFELRMCVLCVFNIVSSELCMTNIMTNIFHIKSDLPEVRMLNKEEKSMLTKKS